MVELKVLYAEDNPGMRKMVSHFLSNVGFEVKALTDGDEAIEEANREVYDVILLDVTMERIDGTIAAHTIRNNCKINGFTPIVGLTGRTEPSEIDNCHRNGMDIVLSKPVNLEVLAKTLLNDIKSAHKELVKSGKPRSTQSPKILDVEVLKQYANIAGNSSLSGVLHDFSDIWPRKIGELYTNLICAKYDAFSRSAEELGAVSAGIGAGKIANFSAILASSSDPMESHRILPELARSCVEVQEIVNALYEGSDKFDDIYSGRA